MTDAVNSPPHYQHLPGIEVIDITEHLNFCIGNVVKYVLRADHKGRPLEDLRKAAWYLDREIARREAEAPTETVEHSSFEGADLPTLIADTARGCDITEAEAARRLAKALNDPVAEPLAKTGPNPFEPIPDHDFDRACRYLSTDRGCYHCCATCNFNRHICGGCGTNLTHRGTEYGTGEEHPYCTEPLEPLEPFDTPDHARYDDQHVRGEE